MFSHQEIRHTQPKDGETNCCVIVNHLSYQDIFTNIYKQRNELGFEPLLTVQKLSN